MTVTAPAPEPRRTPWQVWAGSIAAHVVVLGLAVWAVNGDLLLPQRPEVEVLGDRELRVELSEEEHRVPPPLPERAVPLILPPNLVAPPGPLPLTGVRRAGHGEPAGGSAKAAPGSPATRSAPVLHRPPLSGQTLVYAIDGSSSMGQSGGFRRACDCVRQSLRDVPPGVRVAVLVYRRSVTPVLGDAPVEATPATLDRLDRLLSVQVPEGSADHALGLRAALQLAPDAVFLLTDADSVPAGTLAAVRAWNRRPSVIHAVTLADGPSRYQPAGAEPLSRLAGEHRGAFRRLPTR